jgi:hypothetical protein
MMIVKYKSCQLGMAVCCFVIVSTVSGCGRENGSQSSGASGSVEIRMINSIGTHQLADVEITTSIRSGTIVHFRLEGLQGQSPSFSGDIGSNVGRWFLYWSGDKKLWVYSETGTSVWLPGEDGTYQKIALRPDSSELIKKMPSAVFDALPSTLREQWAKIRNKPS